MVLLYSRNLFYYNDKGEGKTFYGLGVGAACNLPQMEDWNKPYQ